jgi:hypothetical protein
MAGNKKLERASGAEVLLFQAANVAPKQVAEKIARLSSLFSEMHFFEPYLVCRCFALHSARFATHYRHCDPRLTPLESASPVDLM